MASEENLAPSTSSQEDVVSMLDVLREEEELEKDANAVLGGSDAHNCTYPLGYIPRQALYACLTCSPVEPAGVCLACSYDCHEGHDLVELYTKRNFCCDCGNSKFPDLKCKLYPNKGKTNTRNKYNQNFKGAYCICQRPYPDPEDETEDEMIQCVICEDWYHGRHLGVEELPSDDNYDEMICGGCMLKYDFLWAYGVDSQETKKIEKSNNKEDLDVEESPKKKLKTQHKSPCKNDDDNPTTSHNASDCFLEELRKREITVSEIAMFWKDGWRDKLCKCDKCRVMYDNREIEYLIDESDTVQAYETKGKEGTTSASQYTKGMEALSGMNRLQQVEMLQGFHDMKSALSDYLKTFAESGKIVTEEDIRAFFSQMASKRKKPAESMQYFCK